MEYRMPQYLHQPAKFVGLDDQELAFAVLAYVIFLIIKGTSFFYLLAIFIGLIIFKRSKPRGYIVHLFYRCGIGNFKSYPINAAETFHE